jgi:hypothetical protein
MYGVEMEHRMEIEKHQHGVQHIERFQALQAGQYWRAKAQIGHEGIDEGEVLLLESIKWVDDVAHTIVLRSHPTKYDTSGNYEYPNSKGGMVKRWISWRHHSFILADFLNKFEFEPDADAIRIQELAAVQAAVDAKQAEMLDFSSNPETMARVIEEGLQKAAKAQGLGNGGTNLPALSPEAARAAVTVATGSVGNALVAGITEQKIEMLKAAAGREHLIATIKSNWIAEHSKAISATISKMTPFYHEKAAAALAQTEDVRNYVAKIMSGVASLDLYVGKDVHVTTVREGEAASKDEPLTFVQSKICIDEELAVHFEVDEWFDFRNEEKFFEVLRSNDDLVREIFPAERCVVACATTRRHIDYGDGLTNLQFNRRNHAVYLLVRDGWNIYQVISPVESHLGASKLFPSISDDKKAFRGLDGQAIKFDEVAFSEKHARLASEALHYKRFLILCAGLDHRLKLFGDFYDERDAMQFVTIGFQERYCRFIRDGDAAASFPGEDRPHVSEWIEEKNSSLQSGSRLACNWHTLITPDTAPTACDIYNTGHSIRFSPDDRVGTAIVYRDGKSLCVDVKVSGENRTNYEDRTFKLKVNVSAFEKDRTRSEQLPYLCLDRVSPEEVDFYIHHRGSRTDHITYIRLFKVALKMLRAERADEANTRARMKQALLEGKVATEANSGEIVDSAVAAWRAANRGKSLPTFQGEKAPPKWNAILDQMFVLANGADDRAGMAEAFASERGIKFLRLAVSGDGRIVAYASPKKEERDDRFEPHCSVHRIGLDFKNGVTKERGRRWVRMLRDDATENVIKEYDGVADWFDIPSSFGSLAAKQSAVAPMTDLRPRVEKFTRKLTEEDFDKLLSDWESARREITEKEGITVHPGLVFPFALVKDRRDRTIEVLAVGVQHAHALLCALAPSPTHGDRIKRAYISSHHDQKHGARVFENTVRNGVEWAVFRSPSSNFKIGEFTFFGGQKRFFGNVARYGVVDPLLGTAAEAYMKNVGASHLSPDLALDGLAAIDHYLSINRPEGYGPYNVNGVIFTKGGKTPPFGRWIDSAHADFDGDMAGVRPAAFEEHVQTTIKRSFATKSDVEVHIAKMAAKEDGKAVHHSEQPDAPQPPIGVDRWFIVKN